MSRPVSRLESLLMLRVAWKGELEGRTHPSFTVHALHPEPGYPCGRKGLLFETLWEQQSLSSSDGMIITDGDAVFDPVDFQNFISATCSDADAVWIAKVKLWPRATKLPDWVWGHRRLIPPGMDAQEDWMRWWQEDCGDPIMFSFNLTYLPRFLIEMAIKSDPPLREWMYPKVDERMWRLAHQLAIPVRVAKGVEVKHLNY